VFKCGQKLLLFHNYHQASSVLTNVWLLVISQF